MNNKMIFQNVQIYVQISVFTTSQVKKSQFYDKGWDLCNIYRIYRNLFIESGQDVKDKVSAGDCNNNFFCKIWESRSFSKSRQWKISSLDSVSVFEQVVEALWGWSLRSGI